MCAIFGALFVDIRSPQVLKEVNDILLSIFVHSHERGRDGRGFTLYGDKGLEKLTLKSTIKINAQDGVYKGIDGGFLIRNAFVSEKVRHAALIGNVRAEPTTEYVSHKSINDQQPYSLNSWSIVHNGTVANDKLIRTNKYPSKIDSAAIVEQLQARTPQHTTLDTFRKTIASIEGSYAILANNNQDNRIYYATNYRPIWMIETPYGLFFASSERYFMDFPKYVPKMITPYTCGYFEYDEEGVLTHSWVNTNASKNKKTLVVCSGGLDSVVAATIVKKLGRDVTLIHFRYGSRAEDNEMLSVIKVAKYLECDYKIITLPFYDKGDSPLLDENSQVAGGEEGAEFAYEWVPARNLVLLSLAIAYAEAKGFSKVVLGNNLEEAGSYPDNEQEFIHKFNKMLPFAVGDGKNIQIEMPVGNLMKHEIVKVGMDIGAPLHLTWSCYRNGELHCGTCGPCFMRRTAFQINKIVEVIKYEKE